MKIVSLVDDICNSKDLQCEHGLCFYIATEKHKILFDLGASDLFIRNAKKLNINLQNVDIVFISHGHYDHGGGLRAFLNINSKAKIYISKKAFGDYYSEKDGIYHYAGLDKELKENRRLIFTEDYLIIDSELTLFSTKAKNMPSLNRSLVVKTENGYGKDDFSHEQSLIISSESKIVLITGCSHTGITSIMEQAKKFAREPDYILGGFHLFNEKKNICENEEKMQILSEELQKYNGVFYTCHCTGIQPYNMLKSVLKENLHYFATGNEINIK